MGSGLALWVGLLFTDAILGRGVLFERDVHAYWHPLIACFRRLVWEGSWPLWNPDVGFGVPFLADPNLQLAYPPTWATLWVSPAVYYSAFAALHCLFAGWGAYRLGRSWSLSPLPAFLAGGAWCSSGPLLSSVSLFHHYAGAAWIPWVLWAVERALAAPGPRTIAGLGLAWAGQLLAGSAEMCAFTGLAAAGRGLAFVLGRGDRPAAWGRVWRVGGLGALLGLLLAALQWVPAASLLRSSIRAGQDLRSNTYWSLHPASLADLVVPNLVSGFPWPEELRQRLFEGREPLLRCVYVGVGVAALAALGLLRPGARGARLAFLLASLFLLAALGRYTPFQHVLGLPPLNVFRYPMKYVVPAALFGALLAGFGLEAWLAEWPGVMARRVRFLLIGLAAFVAACAGGAAWMAQDPQRVAALVQEDGGPDGRTASLALAATRGRLLHSAGVGLALWLLLWRRHRSPRAPRWLTAGLLVLLPLDLVSIGRSINPLAPASLLTERPAVAAELRAGERVYALARGLRGSDRDLAHAPAGWEGTWARALGYRQALGPPTAALWQLRGSYDGVFTGLAPPAMGELSFMVVNYVEHPFGVRLLRLGAVARVVSMHELRGLAPRGSYPSVFAVPVRLYDVPDPLPSAYWAGRSRVAAEPASYAVLADPGFDLEREIVLAPGAGAASGGGSRGSVVVLESQGDRLSFRTSADGPGFLVTVGAFDSGWHATVDGRPASVLRANVLFRAVPVAAGEHRVELRYRPASVGWGLGLSGLGLVAAALAWRAGGRARGGAVASPPAAR